LTRDDICQEIPGSQIIDFYQSSFLYLPAYSTSNMMYSQLFAFLSNISPLSDDIKDALSQILKKEDLPKKTLLLEEGKVSNSVYFIEKGLTRAFYYKEGKEITAWFMKENNMVISVYSFFTQKPSQENIELLEPSTLISIGFNDLQNLYKQFPEFNLFGRVLTEQYYVRSEERLISLRMQTAQERFTDLLQTYPDIFNRVSQKQIATYLGMSPETLSRLRGKIKRFDIS
jgi:CRP/FNR family transcriptional regulator, anaerobic regulatory protein